MIRPVVGTIATRIVVAVANLLVVVATARQLGLEAVGTIALVAGWTLIVVGVGLLALGLVLKPRASTGDGPVAARQ